MKTRVRGLTELTRLFRIEPHYRDMNNERRTSDDEAIMFVLRALGAELGPDDDAGQALRAQHAHLDQLAVQPVQVAWNGSLRRLLLRLAHHAAELVSLELRLDDGEVQQLRVLAEPVSVRTRHGWSPTHAISLQRRLPHGYHTATIETRTSTFETFIIAAPRHAYVPEHARSWGVFIPLYALCSDRNWGIGDYTDLEQLARWTGSLGGDFVATLPLLASFLDAPFEPSPYSPASRLFWNELFIDVTRVPGWTPSSDAFADELGACRAGDTVDYPRVAALKRRELERALRASSDDANVRAAMDNFTASHEHAADYARFRAITDRRRAGWPTWPARLQGGDILPADYAPEDAAYHTFAQWQADVQLASVAAAHADGAAQLYLDIPLGVNPDSYDAWRFPDLFARGVAAGAPPDPLFTGGQNWGFRPCHPNTLRASRYSYFIQSLRHHLRHARMLRLDHVMSLYRLFWVPDGLPATRGVYVRYHEEELFAILVLESARHRAVIVGEDLGTVPPAVRANMDRHRIQRMHVVQFEASADAPEVVPVAPEPVVASLNTHDMPTFAGYWKGSDIDDQLDLDLIDATGHKRAQQQRALLRRRLAALVQSSRQDAPGPVRDGLLQRLAAGPAHYMLVNLEDLWLEELPQNVPGTSHERSNWQRRARRTFKQMVADAEIARMLKQIDDARHATARTGQDHG